LVLLCTFCITEDWLCPVKSDSDSAMFYWKSGGKVAGIFMMHVNDFLWGGTEEFGKRIIEMLKTEFKVGSQAVGASRYLGLDIQQSKSGVMKSQQGYLNSIDPIPITRERSMEKEELANKKETELLIIMTGQLNWLMTQTRPDGSYNVLELSNMLKRTSVREILQANRKFKKLKLEECRIKFPALAEPEDMKLVVFSDTSHANLPDGHSSSAGFIIFLVGKKENVAPWPGKQRK